MSSFCPDSCKPHASFYVCKKGSYQFTYFTFRGIKILVFMVKSYLVRGFIFHNGKQYLKDHVMYEANH